LIHFLNMAAVRTHVLVQLEKAGADDLPVKMPVCAKGGLVCAAEVHATTFPEFQALCVAEYGMEEGSSLQILHFDADAAQVDHRGTRVLIKGPASWALFLQELEQNLQNADFSRLLLLAHRQRLPFPPASSRSLCWWRLHANGSARWLLLLSFLSSLSPLTFLLMQDEEDVEDEEEKGAVASSSSSYQKPMPMSDDVSVMCAGRLLTPASALA
jgi:hypothetical protein